MNHQERQFQKVILIMLIFIVLMIMCLSYADYAYHPRFYFVKLGMTETEVDKTVWSYGADSYPNAVGGWTSYYFTSEGTIIVSFDNNKRVIGKQLQR